MNVAGPPIWQLIPWWPIALLAGAALAFYIASRLGATALDHRGANPAGAAAAHWLPIAAVTITVLLFGFPHAAVSIIFGTSVACLTLVPGVTLLCAPQRPSREPWPVEPTEVNERRAWTMVLPAALLTVLAGFRGHFTLLHAGLLAIQGVVTLFVWTAPSQAQARDESPRRNLIAMGFQIVFWIALTSVGAYAAMHGIRDFASRLPHIATGLMGAVMISPILALPMIGSALSSSAQGRSGEVISTCVDCVLLNLCVLLPIAIFMRHWRFGTDEPLPFPMATWRVDSILLVILGAALLITSTKRWVPGKIEGAIGVLAFVLYMSANGPFAAK